MTLDPLTVALQYALSFAVHYSMYVALAHEKIVAILFSNYQRQLPTIHDSNLSPGTPQIKQGPRNHS
jgi:hypothetical protein